MVITSDPIELGQCTTSSIKGNSKLHFVIIKVKKTQNYNHSFDYCYSVSFLMSPLLQLRAIS